MRTLKSFAVVFFICSLILASVSFLAQHNSAEELWISADSDEVTVSVDDDRSAWQKGITAGVGDDLSLTDRIHLTSLGKMDNEGKVQATYMVCDDMGHSASLVRTVIFSDYTPPTMTLLRMARVSKGTNVVLSDLIMVTDQLDGDITHLVQVVRSDLDVTKVGEYEMQLMVETSYGVRREFTLTVEIV